MAVCAFAALAINTIAVAAAAALRPKDVVENDLYMVFVLISASSAGRCPGRGVLRSNCGASRSSLVGCLVSKQRACRSKAQGVPPSCVILHTAKANRCTCGGLLTFNSATKGEDAHVNGVRQLGLSLGTSFDLSRFVTTWRQEITP